MKRNLLKTALAAFAMALGVTQTAWAGVWSTIFQEDYNDATTFNKFWSSGNTGRYLVQQTARTGGEEGDYVMEAVPVKNGDNGTTINYTGLTSSNTAVNSYQTADLYRVSFEFNFCHSASQNPYFQLMSSDGKSEVVGFYDVDGTGTLKINGSEVTENGTFTLGAATKTPTTYHKVTIYTESKDGVTGTYMDIAWDGATEATTYTIDASNVVRIGKIVHNTKRYYNHFVFDNLKVELYNESEIVAAPQANVTAIDGTERTVAIMAQDATHKLYYYFGDDDTAPTEYTEPITVTETSTLHYYSQSTSGANSEVQTLEVNCVAVILSAPSIMRTGANSYKITATQTATDGITPVPTIHYTIDGGAEQTVANGTTINDVDKDIVAWAEATGFTKSAETTATYVAAYAFYDVWSYNVNSFPSTYSITKIADAIDEDTKATINDKEMYNLKNINMKDLYVENSEGWLLRDQSTSAFKCQYAKASIAINNVTTDDIICLSLSRDGGGNAISDVVNGTVAYNYNYQDYFIVPAADGAVTVTLGTGVALNNVKVGKRNVTKNISTSKLASFSAAGNTEVPEDVSVYIAKVDGDKVVLTKVETSVIPANTGVIVKSETEGEKTFKVTLDGTEASFEGNELIATSVEANATVPSEGTYYALSASEAKFGVLKGGITLSGNKAYLAAPADGAKQTALNILFNNGDITGISSAVKTAEADGAYYTLQGVKTLKPAKGLYIHNGKKVIVK